MVRKMYRFITLLFLLCLVTGMVEATPAPQSMQFAALDIISTEAPSSSAKGLPARAAEAASTPAPLEFRFSSPLINKSLPANGQRESHALHSAEFLSFDGTFVKDLVRINWSVRPDAEALAFAIERRAQADAKWSTIRYLHANARGNKEGYSYYDRNGVDGVTYYRIRQIAADGSSIPTPAISVMPHMVPNSFGIWQHSLDPFTRFGTLSFGIGSEMPVTITMTDSYGRVVTSLLDGQVLPSGHHIVPFSTERLPAGVYTLRMETSCGVQSRRLAII